MRLTLLLSAAALAVAGIAYIETPAVHVVRYALPGGGVAQVHYVGAVPPNLALIADPAFVDDEDAATSFERVAAMMDAAVADDDPIAAADEPVDATPASARWTSVTRTVSGGRVCTSEVSTVSAGERTPPRTVRRVSGDCAAMPPALATPPPPSVRPDLHGTI